MSIAVLSCIYAPLPAYFSTSAVIWFNIRIFYEIGLVHFLYYSGVFGKLLLLYIKTFFQSVVCQQDREEDFQSLSIGIVKTSVKTIHPVAFRSKKTVGVGYGIPGDHTARTGRSSTKDISDGRVACRFNYPVLR
uniref:Uncharacterized protein n=1 Tax=Steinernema glaseri TaxID=37863 RepID=A0A1I7ZJQ6_9BILA